VSATDAGLIAREFEPTFDAVDLIHLPNFHIYLRLLVDGQPSNAFSAETLESAA
jgi:hypothetical protein